MKDLNTNTSAIIMSPTSSVVVSQHLSAGHDLNEQQLANLLMASPSCGPLDKHPSSPSTLSLHRITTGPLMAYESIYSQWQTWRPVTPTGAPTRPFYVGHAAFSGWVLALNRRNGKIQRGIELDGRALPTPTTRNIPALLNRTPKFTVWASSFLIH